MTTFAFLAENNPGLMADVTATITETSISATVPLGTDVTALNASFSATGGTVAVAATRQQSGVTVNDFTSPVIYSVRATDNSTKDYTVVVVAALNQAKDITSFAFLSADNSPLAADVSATITGTTIAANVPFGTSVSALRAAFSTTGASVVVGSTTQVTSVTANDFTNPVTYRVTAADNSTKDYVVSVTTLNADLSIAITDSADPVVAGATLTYSVSVTNLGPSTATSVAVTNTLPVGAMFVSAMGAWSCSVSGQVVTCTRASVAAGVAAPPLTITTTAPITTGTITDTVTVSAATADPSTANNSAVAQTTVDFSPFLGFAAQVTYAAGTNPRGIVAADLNGDGRRDLVLTNLNGEVSVLLGNGNGTFQPRTAYAANAQPEHVAVGDLSADGKLDVVVANQSNTVSVLLGNGNGSLASPVTYAPGAVPMSVELGDLDGDGKLDLAVGNNGGAGSGSVAILLGNGNGTFQAATTYLSGSSVRSIDLGDLNSDGKLDVVVTDASQVIVLLGTGTGTLQTPLFASAGNGPQRAEVGDVNGDGKLDVVATNSQGNTLSVLLGNQDGTFLPAVDYATGSYPWGLKLADLDGDGRLDIVHANLNSNTIGVVMNNGDGTYGSPVLLVTGNSPWSVEVADFNGDAKPDIAVTNDQSATVSVFLSL